MSYELLISASMLSALWDKQRNDTIDLLKPFVEYAIGKRYRKGQMVEVSAIQYELESTLGYEKMPRGVVDIILNRLSPQMLTKEHGSYKLAADLSDAVCKHEERRITIKERREKVGDELAAYLNERKLVRAYDRDSAIEALVLFFESNGLTLSRSPEEIDAIRKKDARDGYYVGQFILEQKTNQSSCFDYILEMVKGFFISSAIYLQPQNMSLATARFKETTCFLDTRLMLNALGLRTSEEEEATRQLIGMLIEQGATVAYFNHTVDEIVSVINAYKRSLSCDSGRRRDRFVTLSRWDELKMTPGEVDVYLKALRVRIKSTGVEVTDDPITPLTGKAIFDADEFALVLRDGIRYRNDAALSKDVESISKVIAHRAGRRTPDIERCRGILVTTNEMLVSVANRYAGGQGDECLGPAISASHLSAVMWLKCYSTHGDYPKIKLIEDAMAATMPTAEVMDAFYDVVDRMKSEGQISREEHEAIRVGLFMSREIMDYAGGNPEKVDEGSVEVVRARLRQSYADKASIAVSRAEVRAAKAEQSTKDLRRSALSQIDDAGKTAGAKARRFAKSILVVLFMAIGALVIALMVQAFSQEHHIGGSFCILLLIFDLLGAYDVLKVRWNLASRIPTLVGEYFADRAKEKKRQDLSFMLERDDN